MNICTTYNYKIAYTCGFWAVYFSWRRASTKCHVWPRISDQTLYQHAYDLNPKKTCEKACPRHLAAIIFSRGSRALATFFVRGGGNFWPHPPTPPPYSSEVMQRYVIERRLKIFKYLLHLCTNHTGPWLQAMLTHKACPLKVWHVALIFIKWYTSSSIDWLIPKRVQIKKQ